MLIAVKYIHLLSLVILIGSMVFFSFVGAPAIFKTLDKQSAGDVVGAIFPKYFLLGQVCVLTALVTLGYLGSKTGYQTAVKTGLVLLLVMGGAFVYQAHILGPRAHQVKAEIRDTESESKLKELRKKFGKLHGLSMVVNIVTLLLGFVLLFYTVRYLPLS